MFGHTFNLLRHLFRKSYALTNSLFFHRHDTIMHHNGAIRRPFAFRVRLTGEFAFEAKNLWKTPLSDEKMENPEKIPGAHRDGSRCRRCSFTTKPDFLAN